MASMLTYRSALALILCGGALSAQDATSSPREAPDADRAQILTVSPAESVELHEGQKVRFELTIHYSLRSVDSAVLQVHAERYADGARPCDEKVVHQTEGGSVVRVKRGEGDVTVRFLWIEGTGPDAKVPRGAASLAVGMNLWTESHGGPVKPMLRSFPKSFCRSVLP
jgi:hypothetical protein